MKLLKLSIAFIVSMFIFSCTYDDLISDEKQDNTTALSTNSHNGKIPFEVTNVERALSNLLTHYRRERPEIANRFANYQVKTTHRYYKFTPQDSLQTVKLLEYEDDLDLNLYPLEYEQPKEQETYQEDEIPVYYTVAPVDYRLPDIPMEIIADLHFTNEDELDDNPKNFDEIEFKLNLMYEARKLAGHLDEEELSEGYEDYSQDNNTTNSSITTYGLFGKKWRPSGNVRVEDDYISERKGTVVTRPVKGVRVNVLKWGWLKVEHGYTNDNGYFSTGTTRTKNVHYRVKFTDGLKVLVRPGNFFQIANWKSGKHKRSALNVTFVKNTSHQLYALINNAAWDFFDRVLPTYGLTGFNTVEISAHFNDHNSNYWFGWIPFRSEIKIGGKYKDGTRKKSDAIYATVIHEMTHKSHYKMDWKAFNSIAGNATKHKLFLRESWAQCVETIATNDKYGQLFNQYSLGNYVSSRLQNWNSNRIRTWKGNLQYETISEMDEYSSLMIDLIDTHNQNTYSSNLPVDLVSGYTLQQIQTALNGSHTVDIFYDKLYYLYNNSTKEHLNTIKGYANTVVNNL